MSGRSLGESLLIQIIATFSPEAPPECSGLPVQHYSAEQLGETLGDEFVLVRQQKEMHMTPGGVEQMYLYCHFRRNTPVRES